MTDHDDQPGSPAGQPRGGRPPDWLADLLQLSGPRPAPPADRFERARLAAHASWQADVQHARRRQTMRVALMGLAAAAVLVLAVARYRSATDPPAGADTMVATVDAVTGGVRAGDRALTRGDAVRLHAVVRTARGARAALRLANGVELRLDAETDVRFPAEAVVALDRGGVFADTGSTGAVRRSIEVRTAAGVARDVGTSFEVRMMGDVMRVRVRDGLIQLERQGASHTAERGVELLADGSGVARRTVGAAGPDWNWITLAAAPFQVDGQTLAAFLDWAAHEGGWTMRFTDDAIRRSASTIVLRGSIDGLTPEEALTAILPTCGLTHRIDNAVAVIDRAGAR